MLVSILDQTRICDLFTCSLELIWLLLFVSIRVTDYIA